MRTDGFQLGEVLGSGCEAYMVKLIEHSYTSSFQVVKSRLQNEQCLDSTTSGMLILLLLSRYSQSMHLINAGSGKTLLSHLPRLNPYTDL